MTLEQRFRLRILPVPRIKSSIRGRDKSGKKETCERESGSIDRNQRFQALQRRGERVWHYQDHQPRVQETSLVSVDEKRAGPLKVRQQILNASQFTHSDFGFSILLFARV